MVAKLPRLIEKVSKAASDLRAGKVICVVYENIRAVRATYVRKLLNTSYVSAPAVLLYTVSKIGVLRLNVSVACGILVSLTDSVVNVVNRVRVRAGIVSSNTGRKLAARIMRVHLQEKLGLRPGVVVVATLAVTVSITVSTEHKNKRNGNNRN